MTPGGPSRGLTLLKLGGSLITDKERPGTARPEVIRRLAAEIVRGSVSGSTAARGAGLVLGHGSGSFGHVAAERHRTHEGRPAEDDGDRWRRGVSSVQQRAADLHRLVVRELREAGAAPYSVAPSSVLVTAGGRPAGTWVEPLLLALSAGLLPVVYGDVVMDRERGSAIASTETVFLALEPALGERGLPVRRVLWAGATDGVLDERGLRIPEVRAGAGEPALGAARGAAGTDVTGGMRHRLDAALELARRGVASLLFDGTVPGRLAAALLGADAAGTRIVP